LSKLSGIKLPKGEGKRKLNLKLSIRKKILGAFAIGVVFLVVIGATAIRNMDSINSNSRRMATEYTPGIKALGEISTAVTEYRRLELKFASLYANDDASAASTEVKLAMNRKKVQDLSKEFRENYARSEDTGNLFDSFEENFKRYMEQSQKVIDYVKNGDLGNANTIIKDTEDLYSTVNNVINSTIVVNYERVKSEGANSEKLFTSSRFIFLIMSVLCIVVATALGFLVSMNISKPVVRLEKAVKAISDGDLSIEEIQVRNKDEVGSLAESFNKMVKNLRDIVRNVQANAEQVGASAQELTASAEQTTKATEDITRTVMEVTRGVEEQGREVTNVFNTFDEMNKGLAEMASNIENSSNTATKSAQNAKDGQPQTNAGWPSKQAAII
jgi:methyl-accepting chemotaxis protein